MNDNVIFIDKDEWCTLLLLKEAIDYHKDKNNTKYKRMFNELLYQAVR